MGDEFDHGGMGAAEPSGGRFASAALSPRSLPILKRAQAQQGEWAARLGEQIASAYDQLEVADRAKLLERLLKPVGLLASLSIAGGAFAHLADVICNPSIGVREADTARIKAAHIRELAGYVGQSHPAILFQLESQLHLLAAIGPSLATAPAQATVTS